MKTISLLFTLILSFQAVDAEQIELIIGKEVSAEAQAQLGKLNMLGSGSEIHNRRPEPSLFIERTEYVTENNKFVVAIEVTRDPSHEEGKSLLTKIYFSNEGERTSGKKDGVWTWVDAKKVIIDTDTWKVSIQD